MEPDEDFPSKPPLVTVEIVSPEDHDTDMIRRLEESRGWGVPNVWLIDPRLKKLYVYTEAALESVPSFTIEDFGVRFTAAEVFA